MTIILVDGTCLFCNRLVATIMRHDRQGLFHFAHLQSERARALLTGHGADPDALDPIYLLVDAYGRHERLLIDGEAGRQIWPQLFWFAAFMHVIPLSLLNLSYRLFAKVRFKLGGRSTTCVVPTAEQRARFLE